MSFIMVVRGSFFSFIVFASLCGAPLSKPLGFLLVCVSTCCSVLVGVMTQVWEWLVKSRVGCMYCLVFPLLLLQRLKRILEIAAQFFSARASTVGRGLRRQTRLVFPTQQGYW